MIETISTLKNILNIDYDINEKIYYMESVRIMTKQRICKKCKYEDTRVHLPYTIKRHTHDRLIDNKCIVCKGTFNNPITERKLNYRESFIDKIVLNKLNIQGDGSKVFISHNPLFHIHGTSKTIFFDKSVIGTTVFLNKEECKSKFELLFAEIDITNTMNMISSNKPRKKRLDSYI